MIDIKYENEYENETEPDNDNKKYLFTTNVNKSLAKILEIDEFKSDELFVWDKPKEHGLNNCDYIIEPYYQIHKNIRDALDIDYFAIIKDDIRNFRKLNEYKLDYINKLPAEYKTELLEIYNECMNCIIEQFLTN